MVLLHYIKRQYVKAIHVIDAPLLPYFRGEFEGFLFAATGGSGSVSSIPFRAVANDAARPERVGGDV
jgi:hypothetical protein